MKILKFCIILLACGFSAGTALTALELYPPAAYSKLSKKVEKKRDQEGAILWKELDRNEIEQIIRSYVKETPIVDGVNIQECCNGFSWTKASSHNIEVGQWNLSLSGWDAWSLKKINWDETKLIIFLSYDFETKKLKDDGNAEIQICCKLKRTGSWFSRKTLHAEFESADYGEVLINMVIDMPLIGGTTLRKTPHTSP